MTDCPNATVRDRLPDLLHGALDAPARAAVEAHLATCEDCTHELALLRAARQAMARVPAVDVSVIVAALPRSTSTGPRLVQFPGAAGRARRRLLRPVPGWGALAAAAGLALVVGAGSMTLLDRADRPPAAPTLAAVDPEPTATPSVVAVEAPPAAPTPDRAAAPGGPEVRESAAPLLVVNTAALSDADLAGLLDELDDLEAVPAADPLSLVPLAELPTGVGAGAGL